MGRWAAVLFALGFAASCGDPKAERARELVRFQQPERVMVGERDTLETIALANGVSVDDLQSWNPDAEIEPGVVLIVWRVRSDPGRLPTGQLARATPEPNHRSSGRSRTAARPSPRGAPALAAPVEPEPRAASAPRELPRSVRSAGIFSEDLDDLGGDGLADAVAGLDTSKSRYGQAGLRSGSDMRTGEAERSGDMTVRVASRPTGPAVSDAPVTVPRMTMPAAKRCKAQTTRNTGDDGMYAGEGLSSGAIKSALQTTLGTSRRCVPAGTSGRFTMIVELNVGCDGRVKNAYTINGGGLPTRVTDCVEKVLSHTAFPAHDIPDGQSFQYPINYSF